MNGGKTQPQPDDGHEDSPSPIRGSLKGHQWKQAEILRAGELFPASNQEEENALIDFEDVLELAEQVKYADELAALREAYKEDDVEGFLDIYTVIRGVDDETAGRVYSLLELLRERGVLEIGSMLRVPDGKLLSGTFGLSVDGKWPRKVTDADGTKLKTKSLELAGAVRFLPR